MIQHTWGVVLNASPAGQGMLSPSARVREDHSTTFPKVNPTLLLLARRFPERTGCCVGLAGNQEGRLQQDLPPAKDLSPRPAETRYKRL